MFEKSETQLYDEEIETIFIFFDKENRGFIDYDIFLQELRGEINNFRRNLIIDIYDKISNWYPNRKLTFAQLINNFNANRHPLVLNGKASKEKIVEEFKDTFYSTIEYISGTELDNFIDSDIFLEYYSNVSMTYSDDNNFKTMMVNCWDLIDSKKDDNLIKLKKESINLRE